MAKSAIVPNAKLASGILTELNPGNGEGVEVRETSGVRYAHEKISGAGTAWSGAKTMEALGLVKIEPIKDTETSRVTLTGKKVRFGIKNGKPYMA